MEPGKGSVLSSQRQPLGEVTLIGTPGIPGRDGSGNGQRDQLPSAVKRSTSSRKASSPPARLSLVPFLTVSLKSRMRFLSHQTGLHDQKTRDLNHHSVSQRQGLTLRGPLGYFPRVWQALSSCRKPPSESQTPLPGPPKSPTSTVRLSDSRSLRTIFYISSSVLSPKRHFILPGPPIPGAESSPVPRVASPRQVELGQWVQPFLFPPPAPSRPVPGMVGDWKGTCGNLDPQRWD